jgi:UDP:flavonoid glycosyltransferase YjiC (YdhE family)
VKVLAVATPGAGHVNRMMPLIEAFLAQGDEVAVAGRGGLRWSDRPYGRDLAHGWAR